MKSLLTPRRLFQALMVLLVSGAAVAVLWMSATAREVAWLASTNMFGFFTTPFVLESTLAVGGLLAVMSYNQWRISKEGDGWVTLEEPKDDTGT